MAVPQDEITRLIQDIRTSPGAVPGQAADAPPVSDDPIVQAVQGVRSSPEAAAGQMAPTPQRAIQDLDLGDEFNRGLSSGVDSLQMSMYGVAQLLGREFGLDDLEDYGFRGVRSNINEIMDNPVSVSGFSDIENMDDFFKWTASSLGNAVPSLGSVVAGGGIGGIIGKKVVEAGIASTIRNRMINNLVKRGVADDVAQAAANKALRSKAGLDMVMNGMRNGASNAVSMAQGFTRGSQIGALIPGTLPQIGQADIGLTEAGKDGGATAVVAGLLGGALEAIPALRLIDKAFPGVDRAISKNFIKDFAKGTGIQAMLEGTTEGLQEVIQLASLAYHDPTFDMLDPDNATQVLDSFAAGALVGAVTGGLGSTVGEVQTRGRDRRLKARVERTKKTQLPPFDMGNITGRGDPDLDGPDGGYPDDFEPADNTLFEEVAGRVDSVVRSTITPAFSIITDTFQKGIDAVNDGLPGLNSKVKSMAGQVQEASQEFIEGHQPIIDDTKRWAREQVQWIYEQAETLPEGQRQAWIESQLEDVQQQATEVAETISQRANKVVESVSGNLESNSVLSEFIDLDRQQTDTDSDFIFGQLDSRKRPTRGENAKPYKTRASARAQVDRLKKRFPSAPDSAFDIREQDGGYVIALTNPDANPEIRDDDVVTNAVDASRDSARASRQTGRQAKVKNKDGTSTLYDVPTLVFAARGLDDGDAMTIRQAFDAMAGRLLDRGIIDDVGFKALEDKFLERFPQKQQVITLKQAREQGVIREFMEQNKKDAAKTALDPVEDIQDEQLIEGVPDEGDRQAQLDREAKETKQRGRPSKPQPKPAKKLSSKEKAVFYVPGMNKKAIPAVKELVGRVTKLLSGKIKVRVITRQGAQNMIDQGHEHASTVAAGLKTVGGVNTTQRSQAIHVDIDTGVAYIITDNFNGNAAQQAEQLWGLSHELGHLVHYDTWANLSRSNQVKLWRAFQADVKAGKVTGAVLPQQNPKAFNKNEADALADMNKFEFREWMADQFVNWMADRKQPTSALERFLEAVAVKLDALWEFMGANKDRFGTLNKTYGQFADALAQGIRKEDPSGVNPFFFNEYAGGTPMSALLAGTTINGGAITQQEAKDIQKRLGDYETIVKRAKEMVEWVKAAYHVVLAPATSTMRDIAKRGIPAAAELASMFNKDIGQVKKSSNYHQRVDLMKGQFMERFDIITKNMSDVDKTALVEKMRKNELQGKDPSARREVLLRELFDDMHNYLRDSGLPIGKIDNYFPRIFSREKLIAKEEAIIAHFIKRQEFGTKQQKLEKARSWYNHMISRDADESTAMRELAVDPMTQQVPGFNNMKNRVATDPFFNQFWENNLDAVVGNYVTAAVKRAEFNSFLGAPAPEGLTTEKISKKVWNPRGNADKILEDAAAQGATKEDLKNMKNYIDANLGMYGRDALSDRTRSVMAAIVAYQNMRTLLFAALASLPDLVGPAIRSGDMRGSFRTFRKNIKQIARNDSELAAMARAWGQVSSVANQHVLTEYVDNHYMPPTARKWNNAFFKYTGLNWYTDFTRKAALAVGIDYIKSQADIAFDGAATTADRRKAQKALAEMGLKEADVELWRANGERTWGGYGYQEGDSLAAKTDEKIAEGLIQFVNESVLRPNASQRPIMASHPAAMLVYHLKGFMYAIHDTVIKRIAHNVRVAENPSQFAAAVAPAVAMMALTAIGLELREILTQDDRTGRMDGWDYTWTLFSRAGLTGVAQLGWDFGTSGARGQAEFAALGGPALNQFGDLLSKPSSQTIPKALPIAGQLPWARDALRGN